MMSGLNTVKNTDYHRAVNADRQAAGVERWPLPALLRAARAAFAARIGEALERAGFDDLPANGPYVLGAISRTGAPLAAVIRQLGVSKQSAGQLVDALVARDYLDRHVDPADRRRLMVVLTERGEAAAAVISDAVEGVEAVLAERAGTEDLRTTRRTLAALIEPGLE